MLLLLDSRQPTRPILPAGSGLFSGSGSVLDLTFAVQAQAALAVAGQEAVSVAAVRAAVQDAILSAGSGGVTAGRGAVR